MKFIKKHYDKFLIVLLPILVLTLSLAVMNIGVLAKYSIFTLDFKHQYYPYLQFARENLFTHPTRFIYNQSLGLGNEGLGLFAYYQASPLNLLLLLFPVKQLELGIYFLICLRMSLGGLFFRELLNRKFRLSKNWIVILSIAYVLSGFFVGNSFNILWHDTWYIIPLMLIGLDTLIKVGKCKTFIFSMIYMIFSNFYMGFILCLFSFIYLVFQTVYTKIDSGVFEKKIIRNYLLSAVSIVLGSITTLYLTYMSMSASKGIGTDNLFSEPFKQLFSPIEFMGKFVLGSNSNNQIVNGSPQIWIPFVLTIILIYAFINRTLPNKIKILYACTFLTLYLIFSTNSLNLIFHGLSNPVWFNYRNSFMFTVFMLLMISDFISRSDKAIFKLSKQELGLFLLSTLIFVTIAVLANYLNTLNIIIFLAIAFMSVTAYLIKNPFYRKVLIAFVFSLELLSGSVFTILNNYTLDVIAPHEALEEYDEEYQKAVSIIHENLETGYRFDKNISHLLTEDINSGLSPMIGFSSNLQSESLKTMSKLGYYARSNTLKSDGRTLPTDSLFGVKYSILTKETEYKTFENSQFMTDLDKYNFYDRYMTIYPVDKTDVSEQIGETEYLTVQQNDLVVPKLFLTSYSNIYDNFIDGNAFENINQVFNKSFGSEKNILEPLQMVLNEQESQNITFSKELEGYENLYKVEDTDEKKVLVFDITSPRKQKAYINTFFQKTTIDSRDKNITKVRINGQDVPRTELTSTELQAGKNKVEFELSWKTNDLFFEYKYKPLAYSLDQDTYTNTMEKYLADEILELDTQAMSTGMTLNILQNARDYQTISSTIPYDKNWKAYVKYSHREISDKDELVVKNSKGFLEIEGKGKLKESVSVELVYQIDHIFLCVFINLLALTLIILFGNQFTYKKEDREK